MPGVPATGTLLFKWSSASIVSQSSVSSTTPFDCTWVTALIFNWWGCSPSVCSKHGQKEIINNMLCIKWRAQCIIKPLKMNRAYFTSGPGLSQILTTTFLWLWYITDLNGSCDKHCALWIKHIHTSLSIPFNIMLGFGYLTWSFGQLLIWNVLCLSGVVFFILFFL